jgi:hypothetical protein
VAAVPVGFGPELDAANPEKKRIMEDKRRSSASKKEKNAILFKYSAERIAFLLFWRSLIPLA